MSAAFVTGGVRLGTVNTPEECKAMAVSLAPMYELRGWKWASAGTHTLQEWRDKTHIPKRDEIEAEIQDFVEKINRSKPGDWCCSGGLAVVEEGGSLWLECADTLAPMKGEA